MFHVKHDNSAFHELFSAIYFGIRGKPYLFRLLTGFSGISIADLPDAAR